MRIDAAAKNFPEVVETLPHDRQEPIKRPQAQVLPAMKHKPPLVRRQPRKRGEIQAPSNAIREPPRETSLSRPARWGTS
jgi:hypothetical protein